MHVRMNMLAGDPARLGEATRYLEGTVRPDVEAQHGSRGLACATNAGVPALTVMSGFCSAHMMTDRAIGRGSVITAWGDMDALAASRPATARLRADAAAVTHLQVRSVEEYQLVFSSVRDGDTRSLIE